MFGKVHFFYLYLIVACTGAQALPGMPLTCAQKNGLASMSALQDVETVSLQTFENRFLFPDFAAKNNMTPAQLEKTISGAGAFYCGGEGGGATLIMRDNLLLTVAHIFLKYDKAGNCIGKLSDDELAKCQFRTIDGNGNIGGVAYYIDPKSLKIGAECTMPNSLSEDWAVVELKKSVPGDRHCDLFDVKSRGGRRTNDFADLKSMNVFVVSSINSTFKQNGVFINKPTICSSNMGHFETEFDSNNEVRYFQAARCSSGGGNSGGAVIVPQAGRCGLVGFMSSIISITGGKSAEPEPFVGGPLIEGPLSNFLEACREHCPDTVQN